MCSICRLILLNAILLVHLGGGGGIILYITEFYKLKKLPFYRAASSNLHEQCFAAAITQITLIQLFGINSIFARHWLYLLGPNLTLFVKGYTV